MEFGLQPVLVFFMVVIAASSYVALHPSQVYWNSVLPNSPMPDSLKSMLSSSTEFWDNKGTTVAVGKGGVGVVVNKPKGAGTNVQVGKGGVGVHTRTGTGNGKPGGANVHVGKGVGVQTGKPGGAGPGTGVSVGGGNGHGGVGVSTGKPGRRTYVGVGKGGVNVRAPGKGGAPVVVGVHPGTGGAHKSGKSPFAYNYAATDDQLNDNLKTAIFFLKKDLQHPGTQMNLRFTDTTNKPTTVLPRVIAKTIPFSSTKFTEILNTFTVKPESVDAESMMNTLKECEEPGIAGEEKYCATSLESMLDFSVSKLGKKIQVVSTEGVSNRDDDIRKYTIGAGVRKIGGTEAVACHKMNYAYTVFYCHKTQATETYQVPLVSDDGSKVKAVAVCHTDTSAWNPKHLAFQLLKLQPGTAPVCHFLPQDHIVWVAK